MRSPVNRHRIWQLIADAALIAAAWQLAFQLRFDSAVGIPPFYERLTNWQTTGLVVGITLGVFTAFGFYNRWWRYASTRDMWGALRGVTVASLLVGFTLYFFPPDSTERLPRGVAVIDWLLLLAFVAGTRLAARTIFERPAPGGLVARGKKVLVVGAGDAGQLVIREMLKSRALGFTPIGVVDDDRRKKNLRIHGIRVLGTTEELPHILRDNKPDELLIAIPSAAGEVRQKVVEAARDAHVPVKTLPGLYELIAGDHNLAAQIRPVQVEDILGREPVEVNFDAISAYLRDETVLVTGAGVDRLRALPAGGASRCGAADPGRPGRVRSLRDRARAGGRSRLPGERPRDRRRGQPREAAPGLRPVPPGDRLPRRGVQARADDGGEPARIGAQQHPGHEGGGRGGRRVPGAAVRSDLDRQGAQRAGRLRPVERSASGSWRPTASVTTSPRGSWPCASATCSTPPGA